MKYLFHLLQVREGEERRVFQFFLCFFLLVSAFVVGKTARDTFFLSRFNPDYLPHMFIAVAIVVGVTVSVYTRIVNRFAILPTVLATFAIGTLSLIVIQIFLNVPGIYAALYVWMDVISTITVIQFWLLANRAFTTREAKRLFGIIGSGGAVASTAVGFSVRPFVHAYGTEFLLPISAGFIFMSLVVIYSLRSFVSGESIPRQRRRRKEPAAKHPLRNRYLKILTVTVVISATVATLVDYQLKIIASETLDETAMASLFGSLYGIIGVASIVMQFLVTGRILSRYGILWGLIFLPAALVTGNLLLLISPAIVSAVIARAGDQIFRFTVHDTASQLLWLPVSAREKRRAKPFIDGTMKNGAQALSGFLIIGMMSFFDIRFLSVPSLLLLVVWILANFRLRDGYLAQLKKAVEKRRLDFESLEIDITDPLITRTLRKAILEGDDHQKVFALDTIKDLSLSPWAKDLRKMFHGASPAVQKKILELARENSDVVSHEKIRELTNAKEDAIASEAMIICGQRNLEDAIPALQGMLSSDNDRRRSAAAAGILLMGENDTAQAGKILNGMLYDPNNEVQAIALQSVGHIPSILSDRGLSVLLEDDSPDVRNLAIKLAADRQNLNLISPLINNLGDPSTSLPARKALDSYDSTSVTSILTEKLHKAEGSPILTAGIIRSLGRYAHGPSAEPLIGMLQNEKETATGEIVNALMKISRREGLTEEQLDRIDTILDGFVLDAHSLMALLPQVSDDGSAFLIKDHLTTTLQEEKSWILKLSLLRFPDSPVETLLHVLSSGDPRARANALEILDNLLQREMREKIIPLFDDTPSQGNVSPLPKETILARWLHSRSQWESGIALDYILRNKMISLIQEGQLPLSHSPLHREIMTRHWRLLEQLQDFPKEQLILKEMPMYSTLEKTIFMKGVDLFREMPGEEVAHIAHIADESRLNSGESIFREGDAGDSMFIIMDGKVRIHKSEEGNGKEKEIAVLVKGEFAGEMALLDQQPRSASATALEETLLLEIHAEDFYDLMASHMEIMQGIVRVLTRRLREAIA